MRLACSFGIPDYISVVGEAVDLTLCRERPRTATTKMIALQSDVRRIHENALKYHGPASPFTRAADQLVKDFAARSPKRPGPQTRCCPEEELFAPKEVQLSPRRRHHLPQSGASSSRPGPGSHLPPTDPGNGSPRTSTVRRCGREMGAGLRGFEVARRAARASPTSVWVLRHRRAGGLAAPGPDGLFLVIADRPQL